MQASLFSALSKRVSQKIQMCNISTGTNICATTSVTLQKARPWYNSDAEGSNLAVDNAVSNEELFAGKTVAVFGVPAPFTGTCTFSHYPPYKKLAAEFKDAGVDEIICYAVTCPYAHHGWARSLSNDFDQITFMADDSGAWAKELGIDAEYDAVSLGQRSIRFSMLVKDGIVTTFNKVDDATKDAEELLAAAKSS